MNAFTEMAHTDYIEDMRMDALEGEQLGEQVYCKNNCGTSYSVEDAEEYLDDGFCMECRQRIADDFNEVLHQHFDDAEIGVLNKAYEGRYLDETLTLVGDVWMAAERRRERI